MVSNQVLAYAVRHLAAAIQLAYPDGLPGAMAEHADALVKRAQLDAEYAAAKRRCDAELASTPAPGTAAAIPVAQPLVGAKQVFADPAADALRTILTNVISRNTLTNQADVIGMAETAARAFKAGLAAFDAAPADDAPVPAAEPVDSIVAALKIAIDSTDVDAALAKLEQLTGAADQAAASFKQVCAGAAAVSAALLQLRSLVPMPDAGAAIDANSRLAALQKLAEQSGLIGASLVNEAAAAAAQKESPRKD